MARIYTDFIQLNVFVILLPLAVVAGILWNWRVDEKFMAVTRPVQEGQNQNNDAGFLIL
jgi:hypothetical protein